MANKRKTTSSKQGEKWIAISAVSAMVSAIMAFMTVYQSHNSWREKLEIERPHIIFKSVYSTNFLEFIYINVGVRNAKQLSGGVYIFESNLNPNAFNDKDFSNINDKELSDRYSKKHIPKWYTDISNSGVVVPNIENGFTMYRIDTTFKDDKEPFRWIIIGIKYSDQITNSIYSDIFYFKWWNTNIIGNATIEEATMLKENLHNNLREYL